MGTPKNLVEPKENHIFPSEKDYFDTTLSTVAKLQVTDPAKSGKDYGVTDPKVTVPSTTSATSNGGGV